MDRWNIYPPLISHDSSDEFPMAVLFGGICTVYHSLVDSFAETSTAKGWEAWAAKFLA
jgi:hypothetical protein